MYNKCFFLYLHIVISNLQLTELVMRKIMNEQLPISKSSPLKARFYDYPYFTYPWHFHTEYEVIYVKEGTGMRFVGNNAEKYADGDIILLGSDLPHYMKSDDVYQKEGSTLRTTGTIIQFEKDFMHPVSYTHLTLPTIA